MSKRSYDFIIGDEKVPKFDTQGILFTRQQQPQQPQQQQQQRQKQQQQQQ